MHLRLNGFFFCTTAINDLSALTGLHTGSKTMLSTAFFVTFFFIVIDMLTPNEALQKSYEKLVMFFIVREI